ncbi:hypothetical protein C2845_PM11G04520 [Panicum miliaceum]|uniref:Uncharacterized protein n=1 Tax=Panicum miliaceum TaxID=4540 RepID=A0A3L6RR96_PANMI|nr:hypothetical protein C2845_PM11G04520 [Panicum miliaceum]
MMNNAAKLYPYNTPVNKEAYYYRMIFERLFSQDSARETVPWDIYAAGQECCSSGYIYAAGQDCNRYFCQIEEAFSVLFYGELYQLLEAFHYFPVSKYIKY